MGRGRRERKKLAWDLIVSVPDHCLSFYFACLICFCEKWPENLIPFFSLNFIYLSFSSIYFIIFSISKALFIIVLFKIPEDCKLLIIIVSIRFSLFVKIFV